MMRAHNAVKPEVYEARIRAKCATLGYSFVRFDTEWKGNKTKFHLECPKHGLFTSNISNFLSLGRKCTKCTKTYRYSEKEREEQIRKMCFNSQYSFVGWVCGYKTHQSKVIINCLTHGDYSIRVNDFVTRGTRCAKCAGHYVRTQSEREAQLKELCEETNFSFVKWKNNYISDSSQAIFHCKQHGNWTVRVDNFIFKSTRCPGCAKTGFDRTKPGVLYFLISICKRYVKIGISNNFKRRIIELERSTPFGFITLNTLKANGETVYELEQNLHGCFNSAQFKNFDGSTEWFRHDEKLQFLLELLGD